MTFGNTTLSDDEFPNDDFFPDPLAISSAISVAANDEPYVILSFLFQILLEFLVLLFGVDVIGLSFLDTISSSIMLICMFSLHVVSLFELNHMVIFLYIQHTPGPFGNHIINFIITNSPLSLLSCLPCRFLYRITSCSTSSQPWMMRKAGWRAHY
jgi:hypothetical protein